MFQPLRILVHLKKGERPPLHKSLVFKARPHPGRSYIHIYALIANEYYRRSRSSCIQLELSAVALDLSSPRKSLSSTSTIMMWNIRSSRLDTLTLSIETNPFGNQLYPHIYTHALWRMNADISSERKQTVPGIMNTSVRSKEEQAIR